MNEDIYDILHQIQKNLKVPKEQFNTFGKYKYRSCEDTLEAIKSVLPEGVTLMLSDDIMHIGERFYVKATATLAFKGKQIHVSAFAREAETKKGMDESQITGTASSYARKYALSGLFCIDDTKDSDATNAHGKDKPEKEDKPTNPESISVREWLGTVQKSLAALTTMDAVIDFVQDQETADKLKLLSPQQVDWFDKQVKAAETRVATPKNGPAP